MRRRQLIYLVCIVILLSGCTVTAEERETSLDEAESILLYSLDLHHYKDVSIEEIPYYENGEISKMLQTTVDSFEEGHHPWLAHAETLVSSRLSNLVPTSHKEDTNIKLKYIVVDAESVGEEVEKVRINISDELFYEIHLESPRGNVLFVTKIIAHMKMG